MDINDSSDLFENITATSGAIYEINASSKLLRDQNEFN